MSRRQRLLRKYFARQCTRAELEELFQYLQQAPVGREDEQIIRDIWQQLHTADELSPQESSALYQQLSGRLTRTFPVRRVAAGLTGVLFCLALVYYLWIGESVTQTAGYGETRTVVLPDQSTVVLNANSSIRYDRRWAQDKPRVVQLEGEAYFSVQHLQNNQSFTVHTDNLAVEVLGTEFNVLHRRGSTQVTLASGKIKLNTLNETPAAAVEVIMKPGEQATLTPDHTFTLIPVESAPVLAWTNNELIFEDTPLEEVAQTIEDLYGQPVIIESDSIRQLKLTGALPNNDMSTLLGLLHEIFAIQAIEKDERIYLRK